MSALPRGWAGAEVRDVVQTTENCDPTKEADLAFRYVDIGSINNKTFSIENPKTIVGRDAPSRAKRRIRSGDVLFSTVRTYLKNIALVPDELDGEITSTGIAVLRPSQAVLSDFLFALVRSEDFIRPLSLKQDGTLYPAITDSDLLNHTVPLPPLAEQKRIVAKLDALNAKSVRARTELARIETLVSRYKQTVLSKAFSGELTTSQRSIPIAWVEVREMLSELAQGWSPKCEKISASSDQQWAVITTTAIQPFYFQPNENKVLPSDLLPRQHLVIEEGDVLITRAGPRVRCGVCCYVERTRPKLMVCDKAYRLRLKELFDPKLFVFLMNSPELLSRIQDMKTGGNDSGLNLTQVRFTSLVIPTWPLDVQHEIVRRIESAFTKIDRLAKEAKRALELVSRLDDAILAKAFRGELVPQDENDEPAEHLLARIRAERAAGPKARAERR